MKSDQRASSIRRRRNRGFNYPMKSLCKEIKNALPLLALVVAIPAYAQIDVPSGDLGSILNGGSYNLRLTGDVTWSSTNPFYVNNATKTNIVIDGNGQTIDISGAGNLFIGNTTGTSTPFSLAITNAIITQTALSTARSAMFWISVSGVTGNLNLEGTTFQNIRPTGNGGVGDYGPIINLRSGNSTWNVDGGTAGVTFQGNKGNADQPGVVGVYAGSVNFNGKVTFDSNWTGNYGGAVSVYEAANSTMTFNGQTLFKNNRAATFGGAVDLWSGYSTLIFNGITTFDGNYVYGQGALNFDFPWSINDQHAAGGAIHMGYLAGTGGGITFNDSVVFNNNFIVNTKSGATISDALGGAVSLNAKGGSGSSYTYNLSLKGPSTFTDNYVYSSSGHGYGGAIYTDSSGTVFVGGGSSFTNNVASTAGGAIYVRRGTISLSADRGNITFQGNRQGATFSSYSKTLESGSSYTFYQPNAGTGTPNAIYWTNNQTASHALNLDAAAGNAINFYDPLLADSGVTLTVTKTGDGEVAFYGDNGASTNYNSLSSSTTNTTVNGGTFTVGNSAAYGNAAAGTFTLSSGATLKGSNNGTLRAAAIRLNNGSGLTVSGGTLALDSASIALGSAANGIINLTGYGTLNASSNLNAAYSGTSVAANIGTDGSSNPYTLTLNAAFSGATNITKTGDGILELSVAQSYTGGTYVNAGTVLVNNAGTLGSGVVNIASAGTVNIASPSSGNYTFGNVLTGAGLLQVGLANTGNTFDFGASTGPAFAGTAELGNSSFSLAGNNTVALTNATLKLDSGNTTIVGSGTQAIGNLNINGGTLRFSNMPTGVISTGVLSLNSGIIQADNDISGVLAEPLLHQDEGSSQQLIAASSVAGQAANLSLQDTSGVAYSTATSNIVQDSGAVVAIGTYTTSLTSDSAGLYLNHVLTRLDLQPGQRLSLDSAAAGIEDMKAQITGSGSLWLSTVDTIILNNATNDYTGTTEAAEGLIILGSDNALGQTSLLNISNAFGPTTVDVNGKTQTVGGLSGVGNLDINAGNLSISNGGTFSGIISGTSGQLNLTGGTLTLTGANSYTGNTSVASGSTMAIGDGGSTGSYAGNIVNNGSVNFSRSDSTTYAGVIIGNGNMSQSGGGTLTLTGNNTYTGGTTVAAGSTLQLGNGGTSGMVAGDITDNGSVVFNRSDALTYAGVISGSGSMSQNGTGTLILTADHTYTGGTTVAAGSTLQLGNGGTTGSVTGNITDNGTLIFNRSDNQTYADVISGSGNLIKQGSNTLTLTGANAYAGTTDVDAGTLVVSGSGTIGAGAVDIASGATLQIATPASGSYTFGNVLTGSGLLQAGLTDAADSFDFGASTGSAFTGTVELGNSTFSLAGNNTSALTNATLKINAGNTTTVGSGTQTVGNLHINGGILSFANLLSGTIATNALTLSSGEIRIDPTDVVDLTGSLLVQDEGVNNRLISASSVTGSAGSFSLNNLAGAALSSGQVAIVQASDTVAQGTYGYSLNTGNSDGLYVNYRLSQVDILSGKTLTLSGDAATPTGAADLTAQITGSGNLLVNATNSITLNNVTNNYTGSTTVSGGTLVLGSNNALGQTSLLSIDAGAAANINGQSQTVGSLGGAGGLNVNAGNLSISNGGTFNGIISGTSGQLNLTGGTLTLTGANTYTGNTSVASSSTMTIGNGGTTGSYAGNIANSGSVNFSRSNSTTYAGVISGSGNMSQSGGGTLILTGNNTYTGGTTVAAGSTLQLGNGGTSGSVTGNITDNGSVVFNRSDALTYAGVISGSGNLVKQNSNTLTLSSANSYSGGTTVSGGTLVLTNANAAGTGTVALSANTLMDLDFNGSFANAVTGNSNTTASIQNGNTVTLTGTNTGFSGLWEIDGTANVGAADNLGSGSVALAGTLNVVPVSGTYTFANALNGDGLLNVSMGSATDAFNFAASAGNAFTGTVALNNSVFALAGDNTAALTNATLRLNSGNVTTVGAGAQNIGNLEFNGGSLAFGGALPPGTAATGIVNTTDLTLTSGQVRVTLPTTGIPNPSSPGLNLLAQDDANIMAQLVAASGAISGNISNIVLADANGNPINSAQVLAITEGGTAVANASYDFRLTTGTGNDGIYFNYGLTQLDLLSGQTLHLAADSGASGNAATMSAKLTGVGNLDVDASAASGQAVTLANAGNDYTGSTAVSGGTLVLGSNNALGQTSLLSINAGAAANINGQSQTVGSLGGAGGLNVNAGNLSISNGGTFSGIISGTSGQLNLTGGTLTLTGANTYTGNTSVASGSTMSIGNGGTTGSYAGNIANSGSVNFSRSNNTTYAGVISGSGSMSQGGGGTLVLTGNNTYTGGTTVAAGSTLQLGNGGTTGSVTGDITDNGSVVFNRSDALTYAGVISGSGSMSQNGAGTLILTGNHTYAGGTTVAAGSTLQLGNGGTTGSVTGNITDNGTLIFNRSDASTFGGVISGSGQLQHDGSGTTTLTAVNIYTGATTVNGGTLRLTGGGAIGGGNVVLGSAGTLLIDAPASGNYSFANALSGSGNLVAALGANTNTFDFASTVGNAFSGTFKLNQGSMALAGDNLTALSNATLELGANGLASLNANNSIGNLTFNGGQLDVAMVNANTAYVLTVDHLEVDVPGGATIPGTVNLDVASLPGGIAPTGNLLQQDEVSTNTGIKIVASNTVSSVGKQLTLLLDGVAPTDTTLTIHDGFGNNDVSATYGYMAVTTQSNTPGETGLYAGYVLKELQSNSNVVLDSTGAANESMGAKLTGTGNFEYRANSDSITLLNSANDYTGQTTVSSGTLILGDNHTLGNTSAVNLANGAALNVNGATQSVGALNGSAGSVLNLNGGDLTITNGGTSAGTLAGSGQLTLSGGTLTVQNANTGLTASTTIDSGATAVLHHAAGLGSGAMALDGTLAFDNASGTFASSTSGAGVMQLNNSSHVSLAGDNSGYNGNVNITAGSSLTGSSAENLGSSTIGNDGQLILAGNGDWTFSNAMSGSGEVVKQGSGMVRIGSDYGHTGGTTVQAGTLALENSSAALSGGGAVNIASGSTLGGYGNIYGTVTNQGNLAAGDAINALTGGAGELMVHGDLINHGAVVLAGRTVGNRLTVTGNYSAASDLVINSALGDDSSPTDKLVVQGNTSGHTSVTVYNVGGVGAQTSNGIQIVEVGGASNGTFALSGRVVAGAYDYYLHQGSVNNPNDGNWYLRTPDPYVPTPTPTPVIPIRPEVGAYMANQDAALDMFMHGMHDRFGDSQFIAGNVTDKSVPSFWARTSGYYMDSRAAGQIDQNRWGSALQMGGDLARGTSEQGNWRVGVMAGYGSAKSRNQTDGQTPMARSDVNGYSVGIYGTWFADGETGSEGPYLDTWAQYGWYDNKVHGDELAQESYHSRTMAGSVEGGWTFKVHEDDTTRIFVQPQAQLTYAHYKGTDVYENNGTLVQSRNNSGLISRLGVRVFGSQQSGHDQQWQPFVEANWIYNDVGAGVAMNGQGFDTSMPRSRFELKTGVEVRINDRWNVWGHIGAQQGHEGYMRLEGLAGVKYSW
ncbi:autotransporter outer membrane beta-barrel domain-containing protein [Saezia sanguinis]|uniref:autotransporter outer membrane beta-barrel domain-containing protein n=1 Tax=Saezia sanguinis TaxID=1965230 RepID=UPI003072F4B6